MQLLRFTVRNIEHIENNRGKKNQVNITIQIIVLNEQTNAQTYFVKFSSRIIKNDAKGHCTADKSLDFFQLAGTS